MCKALSVQNRCQSPTTDFYEKNLRFLKICIFKIWSYRTHTGIVLGLFVGFERIWWCCAVLVIEFVLCCVQIVILGLSTIVSHLKRFPVKLITIKLKLMSFELEEREIPPYSELVHSLEQALGRIQQLEAVVHSERQFRLAAEAANQQI